MSSTPEPKPFTQRIALILLLALITAVAGGFLLYLATASAAVAIATGGVFVAGAWRFFNEIIAD